MHDAHKRKPAIGGFSQQVGELRLMDVLRRLFEG